MHLQHTAVSNASHMPNISPVEFEKLYTAAIALSVAQTPIQTYEVIVRQAQELVEAKYASLFFMRNGKLKRVHATDAILYKIKARRKGNTYRVYTENTPYLLHTKDSSYPHPQINDLHVNTDISIPLSYNGTVVGVLSVLSDENEEFSQHDLELLTFFGPLAALAIKNTHYLNQVQQSLEARDLFISIASHELKTPLTSLKLYADLLHKDVVKTRQVRLLETSHRLTDTITRITKLINELLRIDQIKRGKLSFERKPINVLQSLQRAAQDFTHEYPNHSIAWDVSLESDPVILGDCDKLFQAFINVLTNAGKFSPPSSCITISVRMLRKSIKILISDAGEGIQEEELTKVFDRFYKVKRKTPSPGMGLGLYLVKQIVDKHRGKITVHSQPARGTTFCLTFPLV